MTPKNQDNWTPKQAAEYLNKKKAQELKGSRATYSNVKSEIDGMEFDSKKEAKYYGMLKLRLRAGNILKFECHVVYPLIVNGHLICKYEADFVIHNIDNSITVVDVKSVATQSLAVFRLKKALMFALHKITVQIV